MTMIPDISDEGLVAQFGDVMHEMPEFYEALRRFELQNRPVKGGFKIKMSVDSGRNVTRIRIGNSGGVK